MIFFLSLRTLEQRHRLLALLLCFGLGAVILTALGFDYIGGYMPCKLCLEQRVPYYIAIPIILMTFVLIGRLPSLVIRLLFALVGVLMFYNLGLAIYHAGAQWQFWPGPTDCATTNTAIVENVGDLLDNLNTARPVSCTEASFYFLGLSMAGWNAVASLVATLVAAMGALIRRPKLG